ncbi:MAG: hypothetical protein AAFN92_00720, partial [Bacteroidota bacterium]
MTKTQLSISGLIALALLMNGFTTVRASTGLPAAFFELTLTAPTDTLPPRDTTVASPAQLTAKGENAKKEVATESKGTYSAAEQRARTATILRATQRGEVPPEHQDWKIRQAQEEREARRQEV